MPEYRLKLLGHPPVGFLEPGWTTAYAINRHNQVCGNASGEVVRWDNGNLIVLPTPHNQSYGFDINDAAVIVGMHHLAYPPRAFVFRNGQLEDISGGLPGVDSAAIAVNNSGLVVGRSGDFDGYQAFIYDITTRQVTVLKPFDGHQVAGARAVNDAGRVAGISRHLDDSLDSRAFWYRDGEMLDRGAADEVTGLNDFDVACGTRIFEAGHRPRAYRADFSQDDVVYEDLGHSPMPGMFYSRANAINNKGVVVGTSVGQFGDYRAFVHFPNGHPEAGFHDLGPQIRGTDGWDLETAVGINDAGVIVGNGRYHDEVQSFILYPVEVRNAADDALGFVTIFGGVTAGGSGTGIVPGGPPVPIPAPVWHAMRPAQRDLHLSEVIDGLARSLGEHRAAGMLREVAQRISAEAKADLRDLI